MIVLLALLMAFGVMYLLWAATLLVLYFMLTSSHEVLTMARERLGQALYCLVPFGVAILLISHYQSRPFLRRTFVLGAVGAILLSAAVGLDQVVVAYYSHKTSLTDRF